VREVATIATRARLAAARVLAEDVRDGHDRPLRVFVLDDLDDAVGDDEPFTRVPRSALGISSETLLRLATAYDEDELVSVLTPSLLAAVLRPGAEVVVYLDLDSEPLEKAEGFDDVASERVAAIVPRPGVGVRPRLRPPWGVAGPAALSALEDWTRALDSLSPGDVILPAATLARARVDDLRFRARVRGIDVPDVPVSVQLERDERRAAARRIDDPTTSRFSVLADGTPIDSRMRRLYREAFATATEPGDEPPIPFTQEGASAFAAWLREPVLPDVAPRVGRYLAQVWRESPLLRDEYPELDPDTADMYEAWCAGNPAIPRLALPTPEDAARSVARRRRTRPRGRYAEGVNVVGHLTSVLGLGEVARSLADALARAGVPVAAVADPASASRSLYDVECVAPAEAPYDVNLFVGTADSLGPLAGRLGPRFFAGRKSVALWFWEAEHFRAGGPTTATLLLDEIWAPSAYVRGAIEAAATGVPVETVRVPVPISASAVDRDALGLPDDRFVFLFGFDFFSVVARKNPTAIVDAYRAAFDADDGALLVMKSINGDSRRSDLERLRVAAGDRDDIVVWDEYLSPARHVALLQACDAYVSLHRAEGFGLTMAEAMSLGKPVVATGFSGNLEFMDDDVAYLVQSTPVPIGEHVDPYPPDARWADPDIGHAARQLRSVFDDRARAGEVGERAAARMRTEWAPEAVGPSLAAHVDAVRARPLDPHGSWRRFFMRGWRNRLHDSTSRLYRFDWLPDGFPFDRTTHNLFTYTLRRALAGEGRLPPDPDGPEATRQLLAWLNRPIAPRRRPVVSRYLVQHWHDHPELQERFPAIETDRAQASAYRDWVVANWEDETDIDYRLIPGHR
jgi:glycosyltransferase involved in cell wall biosynthesis